MRTIRQLLAGEDEIQLAVRLTLLALLIYWSFVVIRPFVPIIAWSVVLAVALYPVFSWLAGLLGNRPKLAATILTLVNLGIVIGPATWLGLGAVDGLRDFAAQLGAGTVAIPSPPAGVKDWPIVGAQLYALWDQASTNLRTALREVAPNLKPLAGTMLGLAGDAGVGTLKFLVAVALTGFLLPAGPRLVAATRRFLSRVVAERSQDFLALAGATIRSVAQGVIGIAVAQGLVIGIILKLADVPRAGLLAFVVMMLGILQIRLGHRRDSRYHLALGHQVLCHRARDHAVPAASLACRQCAETHRDGARPDHPRAGHLPRRDRRHAGARHCRPLHSAQGIGKA